MTGYALIAAVHLRPEDRPSWVDTVEEVRKRINGER